MDMFHVHQVRHTLIPQLCFHLILHGQLRVPESFYTYIHTLRLCSNLTKNLVHHLGFKIYKVQGARLDWLHQVHSQDLRGKFCNDRDPLQILEGARCAALTDFNQSLVVLNHAVKLPLELGALNIGNSWEDPSSCSVRLSEHQV